MDLIYFLIVWGVLGVTAGIIAIVASHRMNQGTAL